MPIGTVADFTNAWVRYTSKAIELKGRPYLTQRALPHYLDYFEKLKDIIDDAERQEFFQSIPSFESIIIETDSGLSRRQRESLAQSDRAQRPRVKIGAHGKTMREIVTDFCLGLENIEKSAKVLWPRFSTELRALKLNPIKLINEQKESYVYDAGRCRRHLGY